MSHYAIAVFQSPDYGTVYNDNNTEVLPLDDDYEYWKSEQKRLTDPLSDDYCKYDNE